MKRVDVRSDYRAFLRAKATPGVRFDGHHAILPPWAPADTDLAAAAAEHAPHLHDYQRFGVTFGVARQRAALFLECGLGKTSIGLAWTEHVRSGGPAMVCAPLAALHEFENERAKFFPAVPLVRVETADVDAWLRWPEGVALVTHHAFVQERDLSSLAAFVLDESSILKSGDGAIARSLVRSCRPVPYRLALSATPAPNDPTEYATHATWLGYMRTDAEFRARFFVRDGREWRVKGHAKAALPRWLARFCLWMTDPEAYGMPCAALPAEDYELRYVELPTVGVDLERDLFGTPAGALDMSTRARLRSSVYEAPERLAAAAELCRGHRSIVWTIRNAHADALEAHLRAEGLRVAQIAGTTPDEARVDHVRAFQGGGLDVLVSKPSVIGHGVNLQAADRMIFAGYDESYEAFHQAIRRAHRQGRTGRLAVDVLVSPEEVPVVRALEIKAERWEEDAARQQAEFVRALADDLNAYRTGARMETYVDTPERLAPVESEHFRLIHGDSIEVMRDELEPESVDLAVFSPPFSALYTYSSEAADMGNCSEHEEAEFGLHFAHFADALLRVMKPGRVVALHLAQIIAFKTRHGRKGLRDFRGQTIRTMEESGFHYYGEIVVPKNPQAVSIRTKSERLTFSQLERDSLESSPCLNDYVLQFRKPGRQAVPVVARVSRDEWIRWASGVWGDVSETDVLSYQGARGDDDEKHIAPLQLPVIERCVRLWSNPGEVVLSPFAGIGSEVYQAIRFHQFGLGIELKAEYFRQAVDHCRRAESETYSQGSLSFTEATA